MRSNLLLTLCLALAACGTSPGQPDGGDASRDGNRGDASIETDGEAPRNRDFTLLARSLTGHDGRQLGVWVVDSTGNLQIAFGRIGAIAGGDMEFRMPDLLPEGDYHADVFVDANMNGQYDGPATDPSWRLPIPTQGSATVAFAATDSPMDLRTPARTPRADLAITLSGFEAQEQGRRLELRVIDWNNATIGAFVHPQITGSSVDVRLPGIVEEGNAYRVDFWVDVDNNNVYSGQSDHAWSETVTATSGSTTMSWTRSAPTAEPLDWR